MPCPLFEPQRKITTLNPLRGRLPLIFEFEGVCHAGVGAPSRSECCNLGYPKGRCACFPSSLTVSAVRFHVTGRDAKVLRILIVEEFEHWPQSWNQFSFHIPERQFDPEVADVCRRAQVLQFCLSYLEKF